MASLSGLVDGLGLLGLEGEALLAVGGDGNSLVVNETSVLFDEPSCQPLMLNSSCLLCSTPGCAIIVARRTLSCRRWIYRTLRECLFVRLKGSRENWTPPASLRLTRKEFWEPVSRQRQRSAARLLLLSFSLPSSARVYRNPPPKKNSTGHG